jgi:type I restriction enzyme S subunit
MSAAAVKVVPTAVALLRFVRFAFLENWSPKAQVAKNQICLFPKVRLREVLKVSQKEISKSDIAARNLQIISKINFGGMLFLRPFSDLKSYKGRLFLVSPSQLIFSKINARQGCIYFHTGSHDFAVSAEYPAFTLDKRVSGEFLNLVLHLNVTKELLEANATGHSKARLQIVDFLNTEIPLPSLPEQAKLVAKHRAAIVKAEAAEAQSEEAERKAAQFLETSLGLQPTAEKPSFAAAKLHFIRFATLERWGELLFGTNELQKSCHPIVSGKDCLIDVKHGCSESPAMSSTGLEVLKISAVTKGVLNVQERKHIPNTQKIRSHFSLRAGDILMCRTNGTIAYVGMSALVETNLPDLIYPDKVIRVRVEESKLLPQFFWRVAQSSFVRRQIEQAARTTAGNFAIGGKDIWNFKFPLPPLPEQARIVAELDRLRAEARASRATASACRASASEEFQVALFQAE